MRSCLICDDHALVRDALAMAIELRWPEAEILHASDFDEARRQAAHCPRLCLADLVMPGAAPLDGIAAIRAAAPEAAVIVVTGSTDDTLLLALLAMGVDGFIPKTAPKDVILAAVELVLLGTRYLPPRVAELLRGASVEAPPAQSTEVDTRPAPTDRQRDVLRLIAEGKSNKEIARHLGVSPATVKTHVAHGIAAIGALNRTDAAIRARARGLI